MRFPLILLLLGCAAGCTWHHSRQALTNDLSKTPPDNATFVTEEDSGLTLFRFATLSEPDHYAVMLERMRRRYKCTAIRHLQLDLYTDDWILLEFPIVRLTGVCERAPGSSKGKVNRPVKVATEKAEPVAETEPAASEAQADPVGEEPAKPADDGDAEKADVDTGDADADTALPGDSAP
jgi:hypothetical protein